MSAQNPNMPLGHTIGMIAKRYIETLYKQLKHLELGHNFIVLIIIDQYKGTLTQQEIADTLGLDKTNILRIIDVLSDQKLVIRAQKPTDRRAHLIQLTKKGEKKMPEINTAIKNLNQLIFTNSTNAETEVFFNTLGNINKNLASFPYEGLGFTIKEKNS
jgi:MarR family transcriptional regulator for hemolysin